MHQPPMRDTGDGRLPPPYVGSIRRTRRMIHANADQREPTQFDTDMGEVELWFGSRRYGTRQAGMDLAITVDLARADAHRRASVRRVLGVTGRGRPLGLL